MIRTYIILLSISFILTMLTGAVMLIFFPLPLFMAVRQLLCAFGTSAIALLVAARYFDKWR